MTRLILSMLLSIATLIESDARAAPGPGPPVERLPPEASGQHPAFAGQTRAPSMTAGVSFRVETVARGLDHPWSLAFLPAGRMLVTERVGRLRFLEPGGALSSVAGVPKVEATGQGGLFDVALDPDFAVNRRIYLAYFEPRPSGAGLSVARAELTQLGPGAALRNLKVIFRAEPTTTGDLNIGGRLLPMPDGTLIVTVGDRFASPGQAQNLASDLGKVVRITIDGAAPANDPFMGRPGARPGIWALGVRNSEGVAINPASGRIWAIDHGARGGDEVDIIEKGRNYGWPVITYGIDYSGAPIGIGTAKAGMEQPIYYWDPSIAPSGMAFYDGKVFAPWKGSLFVGALKGEHLVRLTLNGERVVGEERLLTDLHERIRDVREGPEGALYVLTDNSAGRVLRLAPRPSPPGGRPPPRRSPATR
jgi:glucose/arabinose dehydrogenase